MPPTFYGTINSNGNSWLGSFETYCEFTNVNGDQKCRPFTLLITREAKIWFDRLPPGTKTDWNLLRAAFLERFGAQNEQQNYVRQEALYSRVQKPDESVDSYFSDVEQKASILNMAEPQLIRLALRGLNSKYKCHLITQNFDTLGQLRVKTQALEVLFQNDTKPETKVSSITDLDTNIEIQNRLHKFEVALETLTTQISSLSANTNHDSRNRSQYSNYRTDRSRSPVQYKASFCTKCQRNGHTIQQCWANIRPARPANIQCWTCGQNHPQYMCPQRRSPSPYNRDNRDNRQNSYNNATRPFPPAQSNRVRFDLN